MVVQKFCEIRDTGTQIWDFCITILDHIKSCKIQDCSTQISHDLVTAILDLKRFHNIQGFWEIGRKGTSVQHFCEFAAMPLGVTTHTLNPWFTMRDVATFMYLNFEVTKCFINLLLAIVRFYANPMGSRLIFANPQKNPVVAHTKIKTFTQKLPTFASFLSETRLCQLYVFCLQRQHRDLGYQSTCSFITFGNTVPKTVSIGSSSFP